MGDVILKEQDFTENVQYDDASFTATWGMDLHYPKPEPGMEAEEPFRATSVTKHHSDYAVPYRCLYSRNIDNLLMAGRDISVTHAALGTIRVMRTGGMMGEVIGMAASICKDHRCSPRAVYQKHLPELKALMTAGVPFANIVKPNKVQQDWAEAEIGVLLHLDLIGSASSCCTPSSTAVAACLLLPEKVGSLATGSSRRKTNVSCSVATRHPWFVSLPFVGKAEGLRQRAVRPNCQ